MDGSKMVSLRSKLAFVAVGSAMCLAASPAQAQATGGSAAIGAVGAIDVSRVAAEASAGEDAQFQQLFARWESLDNGKRTAATGPVGPSISIPSRMPLADSRLTSDYGMRTHPVLGGRRNHNGVDLAAPTGTPIYATGDGLISKAGPFSSYGNYVSIEHGGQLQTRYAHMSRIAVAEGTRVRKGDIIGYVGSTGRSTGPHLHYEVRIAGRSVNPIPYMVESQAQQAFALATGQGGQGGN